MAYSQKFFGGAVELASASIHMGNAIREIYQAYEEQRGSHPGQLPVIACTGSEPMKDKYGTNYKPKLEIVKWVDRPAELPDESPVDAADVWHGAAGVHRPAAGDARAAARGQAGRCGRPPIPCSKRSSSLTRREVAPSPPAPSCEPFAMPDAVVQPMIEPDARSDAPTRRTSVRRLSRRLS